MHHCGSELVSLKMRALVDAFNSLIHVGTQLLSANAFNAAWDPWGSDLYSGCYFELLIKFNIVFESVVAFSDFAVFALIIGKLI